MSSPARLDRSPKPPPQRIAFDNFEADLRSGELRKAGYRIRLQAQPFRLLALLLTNAQEVVTRDEISKELWPGDTFVDFEHGLAAAVNKVREALGDSADEPRYIETLPKRGYRFIGKIRMEPPVALAAQEVAAPDRLQPVADFERDEVPSPPLEPVRARIRLLNWRVVGAALSIVIVAALAGRFLWAARKSTPSQPMSITPFTSFPGLELAPAFSPDGSRIAFSWDDSSTSRTGASKYDLYVKAIGSETLLRLTNHPSDWISATWSPDGTQIAFHRIATWSPDRTQVALHRISDEDNGIYVVPALGGPERKLIATNPLFDYTAPLSWSPDGKTIAYSTSSDGSVMRAMMLNVETLESREVSVHRNCRSESLPTFSPSGKQIAMVCTRNQDDIELMVANVDGTSARAVAQLRGYLGQVAWMADEASIIAYAYPMGSQGLDIIRVSDGRIREIPGVVGNWPAVSSDGTKLAYAAYEVRLGLRRKDLQHPEAAPEVVAASTHMQNRPQYSPDGKHIAFDSQRTGDFTVWLADADGTNLVQLANEGFAGYPSWSPDSQKLVFQVVERDARTSLYVMDIRERMPRRLKTGVSQASTPSWSNDGKWIYYRGVQGTSRQLYRCPATGGDSTVIADDPEMNDTHIESRDGKTMYFTKGDGILMAMPLDSADPTPTAVEGIPQIATDAQWTVTADGIYFVQLDHLRSVCSYDFAKKKVRELFQNDKSFSDGMSVSPGGRYLLYSQVDEFNSDIMLVKNFR